jgi:hypothetical protein
MAGPVLVMDSLKLDKISENPINKVKNYTKTLKHICNDIVGFLKMFEERKFCCFYESLLLWCLTLSFSVRGVGTNAAWPLPTHNQRHPRAYKGAWL